MKTAKISAYGKPYQVKAYKNARGDKAAHNNWHKMLRFSIYMNMAANIAFVLLMFLLLSVLVEQIGTYSGSIVYRILPILAAG